MSGSAILHKSYANLKIAVSERNLRKMQIQSPALVEISVDLAERSTRSLHKEEKERKIELRIVVLYYAFRWFDDDDRRVTRGRLVSVSSTKENTVVGGWRVIDPPDRCSILIYAPINNGSLCASVRSCHRNLCTRTTIAPRPCSARSSIRQTVDCSLARSDVTRQTEWRCVS